MSDIKDEQALEEYLQGGSDLSRRYRTEADAMPPARLDAVIMAAARKAQGDKKTITQWYIPLSLAAVIVIGISVVLNIYDEGAQPKPGIQTELKSGAADGRMDNKTDGMRRERSAEQMSEVEDVTESFSVSSPQDRIRTPASVAVPGEAPAKSFTPEFEAHDSVAVPDDTGELTPPQWLELINRLWSAGDRERAQEELNKFIAVWPDYPPDQLREKLPRDMELPANTRKD